jgi:CHAT domain-containing protein
MKKFIILMLIAFNQFGAMADSMPPDNLVKNIIRLINNGKGEDAKNKIIMEISSDNLDENKRRIYVEMLLQVCMLTTDIKCFAEIYDKNYKVFYEKINSIERNSAEQIEQWFAENDVAATMHAYRSSLTFDDNYIKKIISSQDNYLIGASRYEYAGLRAAIEARLASTVGANELANKQQRRARALILNRNLNNIDTQIGLALLIENSVFSLMDMQDANRFVNAFRQTRNSKNIKIENYLNPYVLLRIYRAIYESGALNKKEKQIVLNDLHKLYKAIQIPKNSIIEYGMGSFYAFLSLENIGVADEELDFDPVYELGKIKDAENFDVVGVKLYLEIINQDVNQNSINAEKIDQSIIRLEKIISAQDSLSVKRLQPVEMILKSVRCRYKGDSKCELDYINEYMSMYIKYAKTATQGGLILAPKINKFNLQLSKYVIERSIALNEVGNRLIDYAYFIIKNENANSDIEAYSAYEMLSYVKSDIEFDQVQGYIQLKAKYGAQVSSAYFDSVVHMAKVSGQITYQGGYPAESFEFILKQLDESEKRVGSMFNSSLNTIDDNILKEKSNNNEAQVYYADIDDFSIVIIRVGKGIRVSILEMSEDVKAAIEILNSRDLDKFSSDFIKIKSGILSSWLFGGIEIPIGVVQFMTGPTISGVPYTLLTNPKTNNWLMQDVNIKSYVSLSQKYGKKDSGYNREIKLAAFANPVLRSKEERMAVVAIESLIRGAYGKIEKIPELPETELEALELATSIKGKKDLYFRENANVENLLSINWNNVEIASIGTHGVIAGDIEGVNQSSIILSPSDINNGVVPADWMFGMIGAPRFVVLSTCNSGTVIDSRDNNEITSIASAFLMKGSSAVVSSYWQVNSRATMLLMSIFSKNIDNVKGSYSDSFNAAIREVILKDEFAHPSKWAAFVMVGDYQYVADEREIENAKIAGFSLSNSGSGENIAIFNKLKQSRNTIYNIGDFERLGVIENKEVEKYFNGFTYISNDIKTGEMIIERLGKTFNYFKKFNDGYQMLCKLEDVAEDWRYFDTKFTNRYIYSFFERQQGEKYEYALVGIDKSNCISKVFGPIERNVKNPEFFSPSFFVDYDSDEVILHFYSKLINDVELKSPKGALGFDLDCKYKWLSEFYKFDKDFKPLTKKYFFNIKINNHSFNRNFKNQHAAIWEDPCYGFTRPRLISLAQILDDTEENLLKTLAYNSDLNLDLQEIINNFYAINDWWFDPISDKVIVNGAVGYFSPYTQVFSESALSKNSFYKWLRNQNGIYVFHRTSGVWRRISYVDTCELGRPIKIGVDFKYFLCNNMSYSNQDSSVEFLNLNN